MRWRNGRLRALVLAAFAMSLFAPIACHHPDDFLTSKDVDKVLSFTAASGANTIPADGYSTLSLVAHITPDSASANRKITFATTGGLLIGSQPTGATQETEINSEGDATVVLRSDQNIRVVTVTAKVTSNATFSKSLSIGFVAINPDDAIRFITAPTTAPADGATHSTFQVQISPDIASTSRTVTFSTTTSTLTPGGAMSVPITPTADNIASVDLTSSPSLGSARITASVTGIARDVAIEFQRALPDRIVARLTGTSVAANATSAIVVTGSFERDFGKVTEGTVATFVAQDNLGAPIGLFTDVSTVSGTNHQATATFRPGTTPFRGLATIIVGVEGSAVTGTTQVQITDP